MDIRKIALLMLGITLVSSVASNSNIITMQQFLAVTVVSTIIMMILVIAAMYKIRKLIKSGIVPINLPDVRAIIPKAHIDNKLVLANSDVFKKNMVPTNPFRRCVFRISMEINASVEQLSISVLRFRESKIIENTIIKNFVAKEAYTIDTIVSPDETINFKFDKDIDIRKMLIDELYIP